MRDVQIARNDPKLIAVTFDKHLQIHDINLNNGTSTMEIVNISSLSINRTFVDQISGFRSALVHRIGDF